MNVICIEEAAFDRLVEKAIEVFRNECLHHRDKWISAEEAMQKRRITSKQHYRSLEIPAKSDTVNPKNKSYCTMQIQLINSWLSIVEILSNYRIWA